PAFSSRSAGGGLKIRFDKLGVVIALVAACGVFSSFAVLKPNRILQGQAQSILDALPSGMGWGLLLVLVMTGTAAVLRMTAWAKLIAAAAALLVLVLAMG